QLLFVEGTDRDTVLTKNRFRQRPRGDFAGAAKHELEFKNIGGRHDGAVGSFEYCAEPGFARFPFQDRDDGRGVDSNHFGKPFSSYISSSMSHAGESGGTIARKRFRISSTSRSRASRSMVAWCSAVLRLLSSASDTASVMLLPVSLASLRAFSATPASLMFRAPIGRILSRKKLSVFLPRLKSK